MTKDDYRAVLAALGLSHLAAAKVLGIADRTSRAYALGERPLPEPVALALRLLMEKQRQKRRERMTREKLGGLTKQLLSFLAHWLGTRDIPIKTARCDAVGSKFQATASADRQARGADAEELFQRRFQHLVASGWSFRAATAVAFVETTINSPPSEWLPVASVERPSRGRLVG